MSHHSLHYPDAGRQARTPVQTGLYTALAVALLAMPLSACSDPSAPLDRAAFVRTEIVQSQEGQGSVTLTGEVQARFRADLSFRVSGRVIARLVDVGSHVNAGDVLARIDSAEQHADLDAATAAVAAAESQLRVARATFERQKALIANGFTTRPLFDQAQERLRTAEGQLEAASAQLGTAKDALEYTELRAGAAGVITARNFEIGQVVQAAQPAFTLAQDGDRDAVFDVYESVFFGDFEGDQVSLSLVSDPSITATGQVREVSPAIDSNSSTVRVKVTIHNPSAALMLGSAVAGTAKRKPATHIRVPWTALMALGSRSAVWIVDPATRTASLKPIAIGSYEAQTVLIKGGLEPGERVVVDGGKLLSSGQPVTYEDGRS